MELNLDHGLQINWIRKDPKLLAGSGSVTRGYGFGSETGLEPCQKSSKN
jgi:hypothetical protein